MTFLRASKIPNSNRKNSQTQCLSTYSLFGKTTFLIFMYHKLYFWQLFERTVSHSGISFELKGRPLKKKYPILMFQPSVSTKGMKGEVRYSISLMYNIQVPQANCQLGSISKEKKLSSQDRHSIINRNQQMIYLLNYMYTYFRPKRPNKH